MDFNIFYISGKGNECPLQVSYLLMYFTCYVNMTSLSHSWQWRAATVSAACVTRLETVSDWWRSWPMANTLACLCSCQWWIFWTYPVTLNLFSVYLKNFMFHTTLECILKVWNVISFSQGSVSTLFRWGEHAFHVCVQMFFLLTAVHKLPKSNEFFQSYDYKCTAMFFMNHSVYTF